MKTSLVKPTTEPVSAANSGVAACNLAWQAEEDGSPAAATGRIVSEPRDRRGCGSLKNGGMATAGRVGSWHLPVGVTIEAFCADLKRLNVRYALLPTAVQTAAWKASTPALLVSDDDIPRTNKILTRVPLGERIAVYSTSGLPGFSYRQHWRDMTDATNMAVLPPYMAERLLARAQCDERGISIPHPADSLCWAIYQALYLCGDAQIDDAPDGSAVLRRPSAELIGDLADKCGAKLPQPLRVDALDDYLSSTGWQPPYDVLRRLSNFNSWVAAKLAARDEQPEEPGLALFFIRAEAVARGFKDDIAATLEACGFELLAKIDLSEDQIELVRRSARGGNWGRANSPTDGGGPVAVFVGFDVNPIPAEADVLKDRPNLDNGRIFEAKRRSRQLLREHMKAKQLFNPLHSTDDSREAWRFVGMIAPDKEPELRRAIRSRKADFTTQFEVVRDLSRHGHRSKVELIRYNGGLAVKKTFRNNCLRFLEREASFLEAMSQHRPEILPVFERGENYFITQYVDALPMRASLLGQSFPRLMQLQYVRDLADLLRSIFAHGYDPVDMAPHNLLIDRFGRLKAIDFEFVYHGDQPIDPETSACLDGVKPGFPGEWAAEGRWCLEDPYRERWFGYTGLTRQSFLYGAPWRQRLQRLVNYPAFLVAKALTRQSGRLLAAIKRGLKKYVPAVSLLAESGRGARLR